MTNEAFVYLGIAVIVIGFVIMAIHPYQRGRIGGGFQRGRGGASGPVWFILVLIGILLIAIGVYLPG